MDNQNVPEQPGQPVEQAPHQSQEDRIMGGCVSAFVAACVFVCIAGAGFVWVTSQMPLTGSTPDFTGHVIRALVYGLALIIPFGLMALLMRAPSLALWRGVALALAVAGGHALVLGLLLAAYHSGPNHSGVMPTLPYWISPTVSILFSLAVIAIARRKFFGKPQVQPVLVAAGLGLLISVAWLWVGTLGDIVEIGLSILDALSIGLAAAVLIRLVYFFDEDMPTRQPLWSSLLTGGVFLALILGLMAVRGYSLQALMVSAALALAGVIAGVLLGLGEKPEPSRTWWAVFVFLFFALLVAFNWTEGFEGDYMLEDLFPAWGPAVLATGLLAFIVAGVLLAVRGWLAPRVAKPGVWLSVFGWAVVVSAVVYLAIGRPGIQAETFFVVLKDEADTSSALKIKDLAERKQAVYAMLVEHADQSQSGLRSLLDSQGVTYHAYYLVNGIEVDGNPIVRAQIAAQPEVAYILESPHARSLPSFTKGMMLSDFELPPNEPRWNITEIGADQVWEEYDVSGEGIVVGSADTGVDWTHPALKSQYLGSADDHNYTWYDPWYGHTSPDDVIGHGTHTTGTMVGQGGIGVAPSAKFIACRNLGRNLGNPAVYLGCMQFLFAPFPMDGDALKDGDPSRGADVVNNSWGCPPAEGCDAVTLSVAVEHLYDAGQMYVVSAGNEGPDCSTVGVPANAEHALAVGAVAEGGHITGFSSRGPATADGSGRVKPNVAAPGQGVLSAIPGGGYMELPGTSMAGPHVAGLVALLWSADPTLKGDIDRTTEIIEETAHRAKAPDMCGAANGDQNNVYGYGWIDALAAVEMALGK